VDVFTVLDLFTKLDAAFDPAKLIFNGTAIHELSTPAIRQLDSIKPEGVEHALWTSDSGR
jgi:hypothetical protein